MLSVLEEGEVVYFWGYEWDVSKIFLMVVIRRWVLKRV